MTFWLDLFEGRPVVRTLEVLCAAVTALVPLAPAHAQPKAEQTAADAKTDEPPVKELDAAERQAARERIRARQVNGLWSVSNLIALPQIQSELGLTAAQVREINNEIEDIQRDGRTLFRGIRDLPPEEQEARLKVIRAKLETELAPRREALQEKLTAEQRQKLIGTSIQMRGVSSLLDPTVMELLGLSEEQQTQLLDLAVDFEIASIEARKSKDTEPMQIGVRLRTLQEKNDERLLQVLTESQRTRFEEILLAGEKNPRAGLRPDPLLAPGVDSPQNVP